MKNDAFASWIFGSSAYHFVAPIRGAGRIVVAMRTDGGQDAGRIRVFPISPQRGPADSPPWREGYVLPLDAQSPNCAVFRCDGRVERPYQ